MFHWQGHLSPEARMCILLAADCVSRLESAMLEPLQVSMVAKQLGSLRHQGSCNLMENVSVIRNAAADKIK